MPFFTGRLHRPGRRGHPAAAALAAHGARCSNGSRRRARRARGSSSSLLPAPPGVAHPPSFPLPPTRLLLPPPHSGARSSRHCRLGLRELPPASSPPRERELPPASSSPGGFLRRARGALHPRRCHPPPGAPSTPGTAPAASLGLIPFSVPADGQQSFGSAHRQPQRAAASALLHASRPVPSRLCCAGA